MVSVYLVRLRDNGVVGGRRRFNIAFRHCREMWRVER